MIPLADLRQGLGVQWDHKPSYMGFVVRWEIRPTPMADFYGWAKEYAQVWVAVTHDRTGKAYPKPLMRTNTNSGLRKNPSTGCEEEWK